MSDGNNEVDAEAAQPDDEKQEMLSKNLYSFDKAMRRTIAQVPREDDECCTSCNKVFCCGAPFQNIYIVLTFLQAFLAVLAQTFQGLLEKESNKECLQENGQWIPCQKEEICANGLVLDETYRIMDDEDYLDNWAQQFDLICKEPWEIGLIGSSFYYGILATALIIPWVSDEYGRKWPVIISYIVFILALAAVPYLESLIGLYVCLFIAGTTFPGRIIVALNYLMEFNPIWRRDSVMFVKQLSFSIMIFMVTLFFQIGTRDYVIIWWSLLIFASIGTILMAIMVPESPNWQHDKDEAENYQQARETLTEIAAFNGVTEVKDRPYGSFKFVNEAKKEGMNEAEMEALMTISERSAVIAQTIRSVQEQQELEEVTENAEKKYIISVVRMAVMWTAASFSLYLLQYLNKYLAGSIFINYYLEGLAGLVALLVSYPIYRNCKTLITFALSYSVTITGATFILLFEAGVIEPYFVQDMGASPSPHPHGSEEDRQHHLRYIIPFFTFLAKVGTNITLIISYFASFSNPRTFPLLRRSTAIGICNFCARLATSFAPFAAELKSPIPISIVIGVSVVGLAVSFTFPPPSQEPDILKRAKDKDEDSEKDKQGKDV